MKSDFDTADGHYRDGIINMPMSPTIIIAHDIFLKWSIIYGHLIDTDDYCFKYIE